MYTTGSLSFLLWRTGINLQRSQFSVHSKTCAVAHFWLHSTAVEALAVPHTSATWTATPMTVCKIQVLCCEAALPSASGLEIPSATSSPWVAQGKTLLHCLGSSGRVWERAVAHTNECFLLHSKHVPLYQCSLWVDSTVCLQLHLCTTVQLIASEK